MSYSSPVAWVNAGNRFSEWEPEMREAPDPDLIQKMSQEARVWPAHGVNAVRQSTNGLVNTGVLTAKDLVGKFIV